jgi:hypothetical protein|tara:strand:+ start:140 stop:1303 length:1164 start_codon:yes stop_codon:yes gene_type:complete
MYRKNDIQNQMREAVNNPQGIPIPNVVDLNIRLSPKPAFIPIDKIRKPNNALGKNTGTNPGRYKGYKSADADGLHESFKQQGFKKELGIGVFEPIVNPNGKVVQYKPLDSFTRLSFQGPEGFDLDGVAGWTTQPNLSVYDKGILSLRLNPDRDAEKPNKSVKADFIAMGCALIDAGEIPDTPVAIDDFVEKCCMAPDNVNANIRREKFKSGVKNAIYRRNKIGNIGNAQLYNDDSQMNDFLKTYNIYDRYHKLNGVYVKVRGYKTKRHLISDAPTYDYTWVKLRGNDHQAIVLMDALARIRHHERMEKFGRAHITRVLADVEVTQLRDVNQSRDLHYDKLNTFVQRLNVDSNNQITFHWVQEGMPPQDARFDVMNQMMWNKKFNPNQ